MAKKSYTSFAQTHFKMTTNVIKTIIVLLKASEEYMK